MSNELTTLNELFADNTDLVPTESVEEAKELEKFSQGTSFLPRIQLYSKGKNGPSGELIGAGNFGIPKSKEEIVSLGKNIDVIPFARRAKAVDLSDKDNIIVSFDPSSAEFKRIVNLADNTKDSGCVYGPCYLVWERSTGKFYEYFCNNKSSRIASADINTYLPVSAAMIEAGMTEEKKPRGPLPLNIKSQYVEKGRYNWFAPQAGKCLTPFQRLPSKEEVVTAVEQFRATEEPKVEVVEEKSTGKRRR